MVAEILKQRHHAGLEPRVHHYREVAGLDVDLMVQDGPASWFLEAKSARTLDSSFLGPVLEAKARLESQPGAPAWNGALVYGGDEPQIRQGIRILPWRLLPELAPPGEGHDFSAPSLPGPRA